MKSWARAAVTALFLVAWVLIAFVGQPDRRPSDAGAPVPIPELPPPVAAGDVYRVDLTRLASGWVPVFQSNGADLIAEIAAVYEAARWKVTSSPLPDPEPESVPFRPHLSLLLENGVGLRFVWRVEDETEVTWRGPQGAWTSWVIKDKALADWVQAAPSRFKLPSAGDWLLPSRRLHIGDELTVRLEALPEVEHVDIYLWPTYTPVTIPSGPEGYPVPEAALVASVKPFEAAIEFTFRLEERLGRRPDGSPLELRPGSYNIEVGGSGAVIIILPDETPPSVAAVKDGTLVVWSGDGGLRSYPLAGADVPVKNGDMVYTWVTTTFLDLIGVEVDQVGGGYLVGPPDARARIEAGNQEAVVNDTEFDLVFPCEAVEGGLRLCFGETDLAMLLDYEVYWPSPDQVWVVHGRPDVPAEFLEALGLLPGPGDPPRVLVNGAAVLGRTIVAGGVSGGTIYVPATEFAATGHGRAWYEEGAVHVVTDYGYATVENGRITAQARKTGAETPLLEPALTRDNKTYLPLAALVEAWGGTLDRDEATGVVQVWFEPWP
ncbi:MAG: copper amine oxidase N-terminal domain-containing protein [Firmicutes bacterium]|nr:copper amine oxidase N-terminal domain-containing protein [Bacillota bacterium]